MTEDKLYEQQYQKLIALLSQERKRLLLSQSELAKRMGLHQSDISKLEKLERRLDAVELIKWLSVVRASDNLVFSKNIISLIGLNQDEHSGKE